MLNARLFLPVAAAAVLLVTTSACASGGYYQRDPDRPVVRQVEDRAYRNGFDEGRVQGEHDARRGRSFDYGRHSEYRNAQIGYGGYGNRTEYRNVFRRGFQEGYNEGFRRFARDGRHRPSVAACVTVAGSTDSGASTAESDPPTCAAARSGPPPFRWPLRSSSSARRLATATPISSTTVGFANTN